MNVVLCQLVMVMVFEFIVLVSKFLFENDLYCLVECVGIVVYWIDVYDQLQVVVDEVLQVILEVLGLFCVMVSDCCDSLVQLDCEYVVGYLFLLLMGVQYQLVVLFVYLCLYGLFCCVELDNGVCLILLIFFDLNVLLILLFIDVFGYYCLLVVGYILMLVIVLLCCYIIVDVLVEQGCECGWVLVVQVYGLCSDSFKEVCKVYGDGGIGYFGVLVELVLMVVYYGVVVLVMLLVYVMFVVDFGCSSLYLFFSCLFFNLFLIDLVGIFGVDVQVQVLVEGGLEMIVVYECL